MYVWDPRKYSSNMVFPLAKPKETYDGCLYSTLLPAGLCEINGSRSESYTPTEFTATKEFICDWQLRFEYVEVLRETVYNFESYTFTEESDGAHLTNSYWNKYLPAYPQDIRVGVFGAESASYDPVAVVNANGQLYHELNIQKYTKAHITVNYKGLSRYSSATIDQTLTPQITYRRLPPFGYYWLSDGALVNDKESPGVQEFKFKIQRQLSNIRHVPTVFFDLAGCVNDALFVDWLSGMSFPEGTLLYLPTNMSKKMTSAIGDDDRLWNFSFELNFNPIGWNRFQRPHGLDTMMFNGNSVRLYRPADFSLLGINRQLDAVNEDHQVHGESGSYLTDMYEDYYVLYQTPTGIIDMLKVFASGDVVLYRHNLNGSNVLDI